MLILSMTNTVPEKRPSAEQILSNTFISGFRKNDSLVIPSLQPHSSLRMTISAQKSFNPRNSSVNSKSKRSFKREIKDSILNIIDRQKTTFKNCKLFPNKEVNATDKFQVNSYISELLKSKVEDKENKETCKNEITESEDIIANEDDGSINNNIRYLLIILGII